MDTQNVSKQVLALGEQVVDFTGVDCLPEEIREKITQPETFGDPEVVAYTTRNSLIAAILRDNPASDRMLRIVYPDANGTPLTEGLDLFLSHSLSGQALRDRLDVCSAWLATYFVTKGTSVIDLGGGSGSYVFGALKNKMPPLNFNWHVLDLDQDAIYVCRQRVKEESLVNCVTAVVGNFMSEKSVTQPFDHAVLIGVLCGMDHEAAVSCLKRIKIHLKPRADILAATLLMRAFEEDPRTFRILCNVGGWQLRPKQPQEVIEIFEEAGWRVISIMSERINCPGQYAVVHAVRSS